MLMKLAGGEFCLIDDEDYPLIRDIKWFASYHYYKHEKKWPARVSGRNENKTILLHRLITNAPDLIVVDHINRNPLDNRKCNLRLTTNDKNLVNRRIASHNKCGVKGVYFEKSRRKWVAHITFGKKRILIGRYADLKSAEAARILAAKKIHGELFSG